MKLKYHFEKMEMDREILMVPVGDGADRFHGILKVNETAADILQVLEKDTTEEQIVDALYEKYEISREDLAAVVQKQVRELAEAGLIDGI